MKKQSQFVKGKSDINAFIGKDYVNIPRLRGRKTNPIQSRIRTSYVVHRISQSAIERVRFEKTSLSRSASSGQALSVVERSQFFGLVQSWVAASSAAWGWQSSKSGATIPKSFGFEAATRNRATNQCYPGWGLLEPCRKFTLSQLSLDFACKSCHVEDGIALTYSDALLRKYAYNYHARPDTPE